MPSRWNDEKKAASKTWVKVKALQNKVRAAERRARKAEREAQALETKLVIVRAAKPKRKTKVKKPYKPPEGWYAAKHLEQGGACAICQRHDVRLFLDHNHETDEPRGLLCSTCNSGIGLLREDPDLFHAAVAYLKRYNERKPSDDITWLLTAQL